METEKVVETPKDNEKATKDAFSALADLLSKDSEKFQQLALSLLKEEITKAVISFADVASLSGRMRPLFDDEFNLKVQTTIMSYFKALYERIVGAGEFPVEDLTQAQTIEIKNTTQTKKISVKKTKIVDEASSKETQGEDAEGRPIRPLPVRNPNTPLSKPVSRQGDGSIVMGNTQTTSKTASTKAVDTLCTGCGWEGLSEDRKTKKIDNVVKRVCPSCEKIF